mmetsp:Transcript_6580/g.5667  ORF Transcript_6580/g.5667 Transcript_6580/m.5667 type:complete len:201 (-) Transcript_6580:39-641(-)
MSRAVIWALWPTKVFLRVMVWLSQTLMVLSLEADTTMGFFVSWWKRTQLTQSVWALASTVYLHSPMMFQILRFLSLPPEAICLLSGEKATVRTSLVWLMNLEVVVPFLMSQSLRVASQEEERANLESAERAKSEMKWEWPVRVFLGTPHVWSSSPSFLGCSSQTMMLLSLPPEMRKGLVAPSTTCSPYWRVVTQPLCFSR